MAKVVGNLVSTIKDMGHKGQKLMLARYIDSGGKYVSETFICVDAADAGIGDYVIINTDGGAGQMLLDDPDIIVDCVIAGVVDSLSINRQTVILPRSQP